MPRKITNLKPGGLRPAFRLTVGFKLADPQSRYLTIRNLYPLGEVLHPLERVRFQVPAAYEDGPRARVWDEVSAPIGVVDHRSTDMVSHPFDQVRRATNPRQRIFFHATLNSRGLDVILPESGMWKSLTDGGF